MDLIELMNGTHFEHSQQVAKISRLLAQLSGCSAEETEIIRQAALFHDIGKSAIPASILNKPGKLTAEEFRTVQKHTTLGQNKLTFEAQVLNAATVVAMQHHERLDGSGYLGLEGKDIHPYAKLVAVADVFDALISRRAYKVPWDVEAVSAYLQGLAGVQYDREYVALLLGNMAQVMALYGHGESA